MRIAEKHGIHVIKMKLECGIKRSPIWTNVVLSLVEGNYISLNLIIYLNFNHLNSLQMILDLLQNFDSNKIDIFIFYSDIEMLN